MPQKPSVYRSFVTCSDPDGVVNCGKVRTLDMSCSRKVLREEEVGVKNLRNSSSQLEEIEKGAQKLNKMIDSWASGMSINGESQDNIAKDLLRGALDLQESLNMLSKLQEASLYMAKLKRLEKHDETRCVDEEVKKVIRDSPVRHSLLPVGYLEPRWDRRGIWCLSEGQSTSSGGQSSVNFSKRGCSTDNSSVSSDNSEKNRKRSNVIAKLMGLDERKVVQGSTSTSSELRDEKRISPAFKFEMPKTKKPYVSTQTRNQEKKTLRELLEVTQSKTDSESKFVDRVEPVVDLVPRTIAKSRDYADKYPPIVLMKPLHTPYKELEKGHQQYFDASEIVKELKAKNWFSQVQDRVSERVSLMKIEKNSSFTPQISTPEMTMSKPPKAAVAKLQSTKTKTKENTTVRMEQTSRANKISKIVKSHDVSNSIKKVTKEKSASPTKVFASKETQVSSSHPKYSNQGRNLSIAKTPTSVSVPRKLSQSTTSKITKKASIDNYVKKTKKMKGKPVTRPPTGNALKHEDDPTAVDVSCQGTHAVHLPVDRQTTAEAAIEENWKDVEVMHDNSDQKQSNKHFKDVDIENVTSNTSCLKSRVFRENLLMSSQTFAASVEVLFHLELSSLRSKDVRTSSKMDDDTTLFISYAKEVLERRSNHLLFSATCIPVSLNQLLEEIGEAYEAIDSYRDGVPTVDIYDMLHRDMKCKEIVSSIWDLGWRTGHSAAETEQIVASLEKLILKDFIDEIFVH